MALAELVERGNQALDWVTCSMLETRAVTGTTGLMPPLCGARINDRMKKEPEKKEP